MAQPDFMLDRLIWFLRHPLVLGSARRDSLHRLQTLCPRRLLVLCYGNICRSPLAEKVLRSRLEAQPEFEIRSAGFHETIARPSPSGFAALVRGLGVDVADHKSRRLQMGDADWADAIIVMDRRNWQALEKFDSSALTKVLWLGAFAGADSAEILDPYGQADEVAQRVARTIIAACNDLARRLTAFQQE